MIKKSFIFNRKFDFRALYFTLSNVVNASPESTVKLGDNEGFDKEQIGVKEPFPMSNLQFTS